MLIDLQHPFDPELRGVLENLAGGLFPLADWIADPNRKFKPREKNLPWREGGQSLSPRDIGVIPFLEALIRETSADAHLIARWQDLSTAGNALKFSPVANMQAWRSERNFDPAPSFGIIQGENVLLAADGQPMSRAAFYGDYLPLLRQAAQAAAAQGPVNWIAFASSLLTDQSNFWPQGQPLKSSVFIIQFVKDMLYAMLGMRNDAPAPWKFALLIELGEHRRVGNIYDPADAKRAVAEYKNVLKQALQPPPVALGAAQPLADPTPGMPPVGSPPVNHKIHV
jgi:hypothetical protein